MKKVVFLVAAAMMAVCTNAATVVWGNGTTSPIYDLDGTTKLTAALATSYGFEANLVDKNGNVVGTSTAINNMSAGVLSGGTKLTYTYGTDYSNGDVFDVVIKMTKDGTSYEQSIGQVTIAATDNSGADTFSWAAKNYGGSGWTAKTDPVGPGGDTPEPTSGLLLLVGGAMLALRRKHA